MKAIVFFFLLSPVYLLQTDKQLNVATRTMARRIYPGFALKSEDSILVYKGNRYLIWTKEYFNENGEIKRAIVNHDIDYMDWSREEMLKDKFFFKNYELDPFINVIILNNNQLKINTAQAHIDFIHNPKKKIWYSIPGKKDILYQIVYR
ncbi:MAG: hypothetical protein WC615_09865 [Mucilaginibacter sp.]|jgi:hypothetical protein|uniref:hypothetical protein n=1 Tax=Mucilaginibacter sp. TaxID=1882438 RepID=UPI003567B290